MSFSDRYDLGAPLGRIPAGVVHRATRKEDGAAIAIAIADGQGLQDEALFERVRKHFRRDLGALTKAKSDNLPAVFEVDEDDAANPYAAMALVEGESLAERIDGIDIQELGEILDGVLRALEAAHRLRVIHGDLEPGNIRVDGRHATVVGFGLNRALAGQEGWPAEGDTLARVRSYRAPEATGRPTDPRSDLYSVGALLHRAITGQAPEAGRSVAELEPSLPNSLTRLVDRALATSPQARFASAWAMRAALGAALRMAQRGEKPSVPPPKPRSAAPPPPVLPQPSRVPTLTFGTEVGASSPPPVPEEDPPVVIGVAARASEAEVPDSVPPPVVGVRTQSDRPPKKRDETAPMLLEEADLEPSEPGTRPAPQVPAPHTVPPPVPAAAVSPSTAPISALASPTVDDDDDLAIVAPPSFLRSTGGLATLAIVAVLVGLLIGRWSAPEPEPLAAASQPPRDTPAVAPPEPESEPEPEPEPEAPAPEPEALAPMPLRLASLPRGVEASVDGAPVDANSALALPLDGSPVRVELRRGDSVVAFSVGSPAEDPALRLHVLQVPEAPPAAPVVAAAPRPPVTMARRRRAPRPAATPSPMSSGSLMRPGIATDPGF